MASVIRKIRKNVCRREDPKAPDLHWWREWSQDPKAIRTRKRLAYMKRAALARDLAEAFQ